ncbi:GNAT family N-acetyltransferase [Rhodococcus artemisiae]|uniref:N-acetyltransferase n=1 Tax=Rhodococcus artemisiae TaxID=714159 RepID=A0ABU7LCP8_9NOCA|nr:N-acetyltransferase [Rhodococcus artemisiae]MEE2059330.1 N-acetyltransferase [Rhodococcus artemisiae]
MLIRRELPSDADTITTIHHDAFRASTPAGHEPVEPGLVVALRAGPAWIPQLSLVAEDSTGTVIGHVCVTRASIDGSAALALGPIGVRPDQQGTGAGAALMHAVLGAADALDESVVVLLGHLDYYPRFGFVPAAELGIMPDVEAWATPHFQARTLSCYDADTKGMFRYAPPFYELG